LPFIGSSFRWLCSSIPEGLGHVPNGAKHVHPDQNHRRCCRNCVRHHRDPDYARNTNNPISPDSPRPLLNFGLAMRLVPAAVQRKFACCTEIFARCRSYKPSRRITTFLQALMHKSQRSRLRVEYFSLNDCK